VRNLLLLLVSVIIILPACKNNHVAHSAIQKRKYTKGYHLNLGSKKKHQLPSKITSHPVTLLQKRPTPQKEQEPLLAALEEAPAPIVNAREPKRITKPAPTNSRPIRKQVTEIFKKRFHRASPLPPDDDGPTKSSLFLAALSLGLVFFAAIFLGLFYGAFTIYGVKEFIFLFSALALAITGLILSIVALVRIGKYGSSNGTRQLAKAALLASLIVFAICLIASGFFILEAAYG